MPYSPLIPAQDLSFGVCFGMRAATSVKAGTETMDIIDSVMRLSWEMRVSGWGSAYRAADKLRCP